MNNIGEQARNIDNLPLRERMKLEKKSYVKIILSLCLYIIIMIIFEIGGI